MTRATGRRLGTGARAAAGVAAVAVLAGLGWWALAGRSSAAMPGGAAGGSTTAAGPSVTVLEPDLNDPERLRSVLAGGGVPARIQIVHVKEVNGIKVIGCGGEGQDGLPQIDDVVGKPPVIHKIGDSQGFEIKTAAMPRGAQLSFVYWVMPGSTKPATMPTMSLHEGTPPTCVPPAPPKGVTPHK